MADIPNDGFVRVAWVTTIANKQAPTVAELNAGLLLTSLMTGDGLAGWQPDTASVTARKLDSTFNASGVGSVSIDNPILRFYKQTGTDTIYNTLVKNAAGFVVIRRSLASATAWATSQLLVIVAPSVCKQRRWIDVEENAMERYEVPIAIGPSEPAFDAVVA